MLSNTILMEPITTLTPILMDMFLKGTQLETERIQSAERLEHRRLRLQALEAHLDHQAELARINAQTTRDLLHSLIDRRIDAVAAGFLAILKLYAEQHQHYVTQHAKHVDANIKTKDDLEKKGYLDAIADSTNQLREIRRDARKLYRQMNRTILSIGGTMPFLPGNVQQSLALEQRSMK